MWRSRKQHTGFTAQAKRRLTLQWLGRAMTTINGAEYTKLHNHCWLRTGCGLTLDGSHDAGVLPQGMTGYKVPEG